MKSLLVLTLSFCFAFPFTSTRDSRNDHSVAPAADSTDITAWLQKQYSQLPLPQKEFRQGHVTTRTLVDLKQDRVNGYVLQLPRNGMTPSPTVYQDLLLVSGGFGSKEYYAFDALTGQMKWAIDTDDDGPTSAVVENDIAVFNTESCTIFAVRASTGELLWSYWLGDPLMSTPAIGNSMVYTAYPARGFGGGGYPANNINVQQSINVPHPPTEPELTTEHAVGDQPLPNGYRWRPTHVLIAFDLQSGEIKWQRWLDGDILSSPVVEGDELHLSSFPGTMYRFDALSGELEFAQASRATSAPSIVGDQVFVSRRADDGQGVSENISMLSRGDGKVAMEQYERSAPYLDQQVQTRSALKSAAMSYDAGNGFGGGAPANSGWQQAAANIGQSNVSSLQAFTGSRILHFDKRNYSLMGDELVCTHPETGKAIWQQKLAGDLRQAGGYLGTAPIRAGNHIIIATLQGEVIVLDAAKGKETARYSVGEPIRYAPVVANGRIYVSSMRGKIYCLETGDASLSGWPTMGGNAAHTNRSL